MRVLLFGATGMLGQGVLRECLLAPDVEQVTTGMIVAVAALLEEHPSPTDQEIDATITNVCRCGTFVRVRRAIHAIAEN
jgi:isoquinoline 1-oxidoreductase alpha subunit